jgi:hypothetical protein
MAEASEPPCVAQYLYVHEPGEPFSYPSSRSSGNAARLASRYLECVLVQAASLRWSAPEAQQLLVSNLSSPRALSRRGRSLLEAILALGVELVSAGYEHAPRTPSDTFQSSRYVFDAIGAATARIAPERQLWMVDVDCVWLDAQAAFAALCSEPGVATVRIGYPPDWQVSGLYSRLQLGELGSRLGPCERAPVWIGGEVLAGSAGELRRLLAVCEQLDRELARMSVCVPIEEQLLTLAGGLGRQRFGELSCVAGRIWTGRRHGAVNAERPESLALWHLPSEKGLSLRRAANALLHGRPARLQRDLSARARAAKRFNVSAAGWPRRIRDDGWIAAARAREMLMQGR